MQQSAIETQHSAVSRQQSAKLFHRNGRKGR